MPKKKVENQYYVNYVNDCWKEGDDALRPRKRVWEELWQLYQNRQDWSKKASWQSKNFIPKIFMQVEKSSGEVKRAVIQTRKLFKFELDDVSDREEIARLEDTLTQIDAQSPMAADFMGAIEQQIHRIERRIDSRERRMFLREKQFKRSLAETNLTNVYSESTKGAFLLGLGVPKVLWDDEAKSCTYENVDVMNLRISPTHRPYINKRPPYIIERIEMDLAEFRREVKKNKGNYIASEVKKISDENTVDPDEKTNRRTRQNLGDYTPKNKKVVLKQFWGDVVNEENDDIEENVLMVVANGKYLVRKQENPFSHGKPPYVFTMPLVYPHRGTDGIPLVGPQVRMQYTLNNLINAYLDNLNFTINKVVEYNPSNLQNPQTMTTLYPGKKIENNLGAGQNAISEVQFSPLGREPLLAFELIKQQMEEGSNVNEFISGSPARKSKTATEVELKTMQTKGLFDVIARDLENNSLKPLLEMSYDLYEQFADYEPRKGNYVFTVGGLSLLVSQREMREGLKESLMFALQAPPLTQITDLPDLWKRFLSSHNLAEVYKEPDTSGQVVSPEQLATVEARAQQDARATVAQMSPEEIQRRTG